MARSQQLAETGMGAVVLILAGAFFAYALSAGGKGMHGGGYDLSARFGQVGGLQPGADVSVAAPEAEGELAVGFFGSRYERATLAERQYMRAMAATGDDPVLTSVVADELGRKPSSLSPARDGLIKKGLIYSSERGLIAFTVPHFGKFLRSQPV